MYVCSIPVQYNSVKAILWWAGGLDNIKHLRRLFLCWSDLMERKADLKNSYQITGSVSFSQSSVDTFSPLSFGSWTLGNLRLYILKTTWIKAIIDSQLNAASYFSMIKYNKVKFGFLKRNVRVRTHWYGMLCFLCSVVNHICFYSASS